ncbi:MAG: thiamine diphosphokinase [Propionibacteriaceae bacterium]|jgi:thiamine pyrophosphokinase|nr:thiamine diphosphokinase [Propionibacteriaceae bacterium]
MSPSSSDPSGRCFIVGAGPVDPDPPTPGPGDYVIAADGGYAATQRWGWVTDLVVGDFDSIEQPIGENLIVCPVAKDDTDLLVAFRAGWDRGYRQFHLLGASGGRFDHTLANLQTLAAIAGAGGQGFLFGSTTVVTALHQGRLSFAAGARGTISVFAHSDQASGVDESGLLYSLDDATLDNTYPRGVSNAFTGRPSQVSVRRGTLIVVFPRAVPLPTFDPW